MKHRAQPLLLLLPLLAAGAAQAAAADEPRRVAEQWLRQHFDQPGNRVVAAAEPADTRLQPPSCAQPWQAALPDGARAAPRMSVEVRCPSTGWRMQVPVKLQLFRTVLVANKPLQRGDGVTAADVRGEERDVTRLGYGYIDGLDQVAGRLLSRPLGAGAVLAPAAFGGRQTVRAGDRVQLIARVDGIEVRASGVALGGGDTGARLRVRNDSSGRTVDAMVRDPGVVEALP
ncbi:flagellar basal body P-ring formation protein FlgA [Dyella sp. LX-66]|uniref:flagellar basal body P-ring formation chaperone FlgA n=1 Tax=unclassified Dyella TaxID=2634549 RepID=UPI001BE00E2E|nr:MULTISPECIES: flagellar basal body P-ring formation chaperone FlgA [unclassified Dyella]MBT2116015.1 flagellar basal body P-ring formation protein FlgA [Dyella sp. LX-1]MBT2138025.1 flagellar basal body P-ring formation protein FlgA [Dyella sp. LX-66]